ncbi:MAG: hypothetical protein QOD99_2930 [Chthoniobacter sp.]|jgi:hypothetical protein|nr:hypothetical protein [Chthoniobacter sp.]
MKNSVSLAVAITRGLIRSQHTRRSVMFIVVLAALLMLFCGATFLSGLLEERRFAFVCYWAVCAWLTLAAILLAIFDLVAVRAAASRQRRELKKEIFSAADEDKT